MDKICMKGLKFYGYHGVYDFEKEEGQHFIVDIIIYKDLLEACKTDDLNKSISYADVFEDIKPIFSKDSAFDLIESVAQNIADLIIEKYKAVKVDVEVKKPEVALEGTFEYFSVAISREK